MVGILLQCLAKSGDGGISVSGDVLINPFSLQALCGLEVQSSDAQAAASVALVARKGGKDHVSPRGAVEVQIEDREDDWKNVLDEVVE